MDDKPFPSQLYPRVIEPYLIGQTMTGGRSTFGTEQVISSPGPWWGMRYSGCPVFTDDQILDFRAWAFSLDGRAGTTLVPAMDWMRANWPADQYGRVLSPENVRRSRLDQTIFADPPIPAQSRIIAQTLAAAPLRATTLRIGVSQGRPIRPGMFFSVGVRLYTVIAKPAEDTFTIRPPLREPVAAGASVNFENPVCRMRLANDDGARLALEYGRWGFVDLEFVEAI